MSEIDESENFDIFVKALCLLHQRRWEVQMKNARGVFSLPWNVERGVWELFFEVRMVEEVKEDGHGDGDCNNDGNYEAQILI